MLTMFELNVEYDSGGPEDGILCHDCTTEFECDVNLFQPENVVFEQVEEKYRELNANDAEFIGCSVIRIIPEDEAEEIRKMWQAEENYWTERERMVNS